MDFRRKANPGAHVRSTATGSPAIDQRLLAGCSKLQSPFRQKGPTLEIVRNVLLSVESWKKLSIVVILMADLPSSA